MANTSIERGYSADMEARVAILEQIARDTRSSLERIERRLDLVDVRIASVETSIRTDLRHIQSDSMGNFLCVLTIVLGGFSVLVGLMSHGFHWLNF